MIFHASGIVEVSAILIRQDADTSGDQVKQRRRSLVCRAYQFLDTAINSRGSNEMQPVDIGRLFSCPVLNVVQASDNELSVTGECGPEDILAYKLDVLLNLDFGKAVGNASQVARFGIWELFVGDGVVPPGQAGFWEVMQGRPVTSCGLHILDDSEQSPDMADMGCYGPLFSGEEPASLPSRNAALLVAKASSSSDRRLVGS